MKNQLILLFTTFLLSCQQQSTQNISVDKINASGQKVIFFPDTSLKENQTKVRQIIFSALAECNKYLKNDSLIFYISPVLPEDKETIKRMGGASGITFNSKQISIEIDPAAITWKETLKYAVAHEYNHAYYMKDHFDSTNNSTLINYLVFEGKADYFAHLLYPDVIVPWTLALSEKERSALWSKIRSNLQSKNDSLQGEIMFGSETYPLWGGYRLGFNIVQSALKNNSNLQVKTWTNFTANKILEMSNYKPDI